MNKKRLPARLYFFVIPLVILACTFTGGIPQAVAPLVTTVAVVPTPIPVKLPEVITNEEAVLVNLYQKANPAVVKITTYSRQGGLVSPSGEGSGFVYDTDADIITNAHVTHGADQIEVSFSDGAIYEAQLVGEDLHSDLAVVKVDQLPTGVSPLPLGTIDEVAVGQTVVAIGNPFGLGGTLTKGIVSALGRSIPALTSFSIPQAIQTDAPINPGNSGGPLLNLKGEVIGVNSQIETGDTGSRVNSGIGFAIPVSIISRVIPVLIDTGVYHWPWIGVSGTTVYPALVKAMDLPVEKGAYIAQIYPNTAASKAHLQGADKQTTVDGRVVEVGGDVIVAIDDQPVTTFEDVLLYLTLNTKPGQQVVLKIVRDGETIEVPLTLEERPNTINQIP
jgi:S1-C subfamily serine protease